MRFFIKSLMISLLFVSCNNSTQFNRLIAGSNGPRISTEKLDTVKTKPYLVFAKPDVFERAFFPGTHLNMDSFRIDFYSVDIGKINIESGKIIACDPIVMQDAKPFTQLFPIGQFPVQLAIAKIKDDERVAYSRIIFSDSSVVKWEFALIEGQKQDSIYGENFYGYGVDAGIGMYIDEKANTAFKLFSKADNNIWSKIFIDEMDKHYRNTWQYVIHKFNAHNFASFSTGYGDGRYATYIGYDKKENPCMILTDFGLVEWWKKKQ